MPDVSALVAEPLAAAVTDVFGVMGNGNAYFLDAIERLGVRFTPVRHEAGAVVAADAFHRAGGGVAAATTTYGAGFTNTLTALAESAQARIPLVLVAGAEPTTGPRPWDVDQAALAAGVGVRTITVDVPSAAAERTAEAVATATAERRPVVLAVPYDLAHAPAQASLAPVPARDPLPAGDEDLARRLAPIADLLSAARRPVLLAGRGAWLAGAGEALGRLAAASGALTGSTALGRGLFPEPSTDLGVVGGFGQQDAMARIYEADVVVAFGASLNQFTMRFGRLVGPEAVLAQVDVEAAPTHPRVDHFARADARIAAQVLADLLEDRGRTASGWPPDSARVGAPHPGEEVAADGRLDPRAVARRLAELLPEDCVVVSDGGHFLGWANTYWPVASPDRMIMVGTAYQSIGLGWPSVVGAARAKPLSTVVLTTGDGGGLMALADLESAVRVAGGRGIAVVWNDAAYGAELNLYGLKGLAQAPMRIPEVDFAALGEAVGAEGVPVTRLADLERLGLWRTEPVERRRFLVLDCRISPDVVAPYQSEVIAAHG